MNTSGQATGEYSVPGGKRLQPSDIVTGPDGNVWFAEAYTGQIARLVPGD